MRFDEEGQVRGVHLGGFDPAEQEAALRQRAWTERSLLPTVDWTLLARDPEAFEGQYRQAFSPEVGTVGGEYPFAEALVAELQALRDARPQLAARAESVLMTRFIQISQAKLDELGKHKNDQLGYVGVTLTHPFVQYVLNSENVAVGSKLLVAARTRCFTDRDEHGEPLARWMLDASAFFPRLPVRTPHELRSWMHEVVAATPDRPSGEVQQLVRNMVQVELLRTLSTPGCRLNALDAAYVRDVQGTLEGADPGTVTRLGLALDPHLALLAQRDLREMPRGSLFEQHHAFSRTWTGISTFTRHPPLREAYEGEIRRRVEGEPHPALRHQWLLDVLSERKTGALNSDLQRLLLKVAADRVRATFRPDAAAPESYRASLEAPAFRDFVCETFAATFPALLGAEPARARAGYQTRFREMVNSLAKTAPPRITVDVIQRISTQEIGNQLLYQEELGAFLRETLEQCGLSGLIENNVKAALGDALLIRANADDREREHLIDFLVAPCTRAKCETYLTTLKRRIPGAGDGGLLVSSLLGEEARRQYLETVHRNFWNFPLAGRVLAAKVILFDTRQLAHIGSGDNAFDKAINVWGERLREDQEIRKRARMVLARVIPEGAKYSSDARIGLQCYLNATKSREDRRLLLAALLVASHPEGEQVLDEEERLGHAIGLMLDALAAAGRKTKQGAESSPYVSDKIKKSWQKAKTLAMDVPRYLILQWNRERGPQNERDPSVPVRLGKVYGAGSWAVTYGVHRPDRKYVARSLLYPNVRPSARNEFGILQRATRALGRHLPRYRFAHDMVRQASLSSVPETNMTHGAKQEDVSRRLYHRARVTVGEKVFPFGTPKFEGHGEDHKDFAPIDGPHFKDLLESGELDPDLAMACLVMELFNLLAGRPFCEDRHGGQELVNDHIWHIDVGAFSVTQTSPRQLQLMGTFLAGLVGGVQVLRRPLNDVLRDELDRYGKEDEVDWVSRVQRTPLALQDFAKVLPEERRLAAVGAVLASGRVHPVLLESFRARLGDSLGDRALEHLVQLGRESGITLEVAEETFDACEDPNPLGPMPGPDPLLRLYGVHEDLEAKRGRGEAPSLKDRARWLGTVAWATLREGRVPRPPSDDGSM